EEHAPAAAEIYSSLLADEALPAKLRQRAREGLSLLSGGGAFGQRFEAWSRNFLRHASDPKALAAMTAGGLAYRLVRMGVAGRLLQAAASPWTRGALAQGLAASGGFGAEALAFTSVHRAMDPSPLSWSQDLSHASLTLGALKLSGGAAGAVSNRLLGTNPRSALAAGLFQQSSLLGGILLGAKLEKAAGWREENLDSWEALSTLLHFNVAGQLSRRWLGSGFSAWENELDLRWRQTPWQGPKPWGPPMALAGAGGPMVTAPRYLAENRNSESGLTPPIVRLLEEKYLRRFPKDELGYYSREIVSRVCGIRCSLPGFHENLLTALLQAPRVGQISQLYTVLAIERLFVTDALSSSRGSFGYAPLQLLLGHVLTESEPGLRHHAMQTIFGIFERGFSRADSAELLLTYAKHPVSPAQDKPVYDGRFHSQHAAEATQAWSSYRPEDIVPLFNFAYQEAGIHAAKASRIIEILGSGRHQASYLSAEIDAAIEYARFHPQGDLVLRRLFHIFESSDLSVKLSEIIGEPSKISTERYVEALANNGHSKEKIAETLNGSVHTAYFNDMRLAETVAAVFKQVTPYLRNPALREANRDRLIQAFLDHAAVHRHATAGDLFRLLKAGHFPEADFYEQAWRNGDLKVQVLPEREFRRQVAAWGQAQDCEWTLFMQGSFHGEPDRILIRELPPLRIGNPAERDQSFSELVWRLRGLVHELEHWRHFNGIGPDGPVQPFRLAGISRGERLTTEIMAYLKEFSWRAMNTDDHFLHIARRLGDTLPLFFRNVAEQSYF
ncbi:MAG TPA: hypothetical protein VFW62_00185, partial [bacterium]|nr:hypothetical protein [bacterium]